MTWFEKAMQNPELLKRALADYLCPNTLFPEAKECIHDCKAHWDSEAPESADEKEDNK